jgi:hypothetical protein
MNSPKERVVMPASMTTLVIVPTYPVKQLSGSIIPKKLLQADAIQIDFNPISGTILSFRQAY